MAIVLKCTDKRVWGVAVALPDLGVQTPSKENGTFEVDDELKKAAEALVKDYNGRYAFYEEGEEEVVKKEEVKEPVKEESAKEEKEVEELTPQTEENDLNQGEEDELNEETKDEDEITGAAETGAASTTEDEGPTYAEVLGTKTRKELEDMCKEFPGSEWRGKNKEMLVEYLLQKLGKEEE